MPELESSSRVGSIEPRASEVQAECHVERLPQRLRRKVDLAAEFRQPLGFGSSEVRISWDLGAALGLLDRRVQSARDVFGFLKVGELPLERGVEHLTHRPEVFSDGVDLADDVRKELQIGVVVADEVEYRHVARLAVTVQATVPLLKA